MPAMRRIAAGTTVGVLVLASIGAGFALWRRAASDTPQVHRLADGTLASFAADTRLVPAQGFPVRREVSVEGEALLRVPVARRPLTLDTPLLRIDVIRTSTLLVTARARQAGEEVRMLSGEAIVSKRYPSPYPAPARLRAGEMAMVNRTIDLMETEPIAAHTLARMREWAKTLR